MSLLAIHGSAATSIVPAGVVTEDLTVAARILEQHKLARAHAESAVEHAIMAGELLREQKRRLPHGKFAAWVKTECPDISERSARLYMQAARQNGNALPISSVRGLFGSSRQKALTTTVNLPDLIEAAVVALRRAMRGVDEDPCAGVARLTDIIQRAECEEYVDDRAILGLGRKRKRGPA